MALTDMSSNLLGPELILDSRKMPPLFRRFLPRRRRAVVVYLKRQDNVHSSKVTEFDKNHGRVIIDAIYMGMKFAIFRADCSVFVFKLNELLFKLNYLAVTEAFSVFSVEKIT